MAKRSRTPAIRTKIFDPIAKITRLWKRIDAVLEAHRDDAIRQFAERGYDALRHALRAVERRDGDALFDWFFRAVEQVVRIEFVPEIRRASVWEQDSIKLENMIMNRAKKAAPEGGKARAAKFAAENGTLIAEALKLRKLNRHLSAKDIGVRLHRDFPSRSANAIARIVGPHLPKRSS